MLKLNTLSCLCTDVCLPSVAVTHIIKICMKILADLCNPKIRLKFSVRQSFNRQTAMVSPNIDLSQTVLTPPSCIYTHINSCAQLDKHNYTVYILYSIHAYKHTYGMKEYIPHLA